MILWALLAGCGWFEASEVPAGLGDEAVVVRVRDGAFEVAPATGGEVLGRVGWSVLDADPVDASEPAIASVLEGASGLWVDLPPSLPWYRVRKVLGSAESVGLDEVYLSVEGGAHPPLRAGTEPRIGLKMTCGEGPLDFSGVQPRITVALQRSSEGSWAVANARFLPIVDGVPTDGLPATCLEPRSCDDWFEGDEAEACRIGRAEPFDGRVALGGPVGCLLPFLRSPDDLPTWTTELPPVLRGLGIVGGEPILISPEARIRWDTVFAMLQGFERAGLPVPALGKPLVEGNDGPPLCTADVTDEAALSRAGARRAGTLMGRGATEPEEAP